MRHGDKSLSFSEFPVPATTIARALAHIVYLTHELVSPPIYSGALVHDFTDQSPVDPAFKVSILTRRCDTNLHSVL